MKIEFRKVPQTAKELVVDYNSVKIEGTFCKISQSLVKIDAVLKGSTDIDCCRCGITRRNGYEHEKAPYGCRGPFADDCSLPLQHRSQRR